MGLEPRLPSWRTASHLHAILARGLALGIRCRKVLALVGRVRDDVAVDQSARRLAARALAVGARRVSSPRETTLVDTVDQAGCAQQQCTTAADDEVGQTIRRRMHLDSLSASLRSHRQASQSNLLNWLLYGRSTRSQSATGHPAIATRKLVRGTTTHLSSRRASLL